MISPGTEQAGKECGLTSYVPVPFLPRIPHLFVPGERLLTGRFPGVLSCVPGAPGLLTGKYACRKTGGARIGDGGSGRHKTAYFAGFSRRA